MIPEPHYTLINTSFGKDPAVVVINSALRNFPSRQTFEWHLRIGIDCKLIGSNGMPTSAEGEVLHLLEEQIASSIDLQRNVIFLARITCRGERVLLYRVHDPEVTNDALQLLVSPESQLREWDYQMEHDPDWELAQPELQLIEKDIQFN
jgi:hypothetical protein